MVKQNNTLTNKKIFAAGYAQGQQNCQCGQTIPDNTPRNTSDQDNFPSYYLSQSNKKREKGEGQFGAYETLWGKSR
jgi:hypothetical protein